MADGQSRAHSRCLVAGLCISRGEFTVPPSFRLLLSKMLAVALFENDTLTHLDLSYNSVTPSAALVFAFALKVRGCAHSLGAAYVPWK